MGFRFSKYILYALLAVIPFWLIFYSFPFGHKIKMSLMGVSTSSVALVRWPLNEITKLVTYRKTWEENRKMREDVGALRSRVIQLEETVRESNRYDRLYQFRDIRGLAGVVAVVVARAPSNWNSCLMINRGRDDGLRPGLAVVNSEGVVGKVAESSDRVSKIILVRDPGFSVAVINRRSRESALLSGSLTGRCRMLYLPDNADVEVGDEIITSALSSDFPPGLMVGVVSSVVMVEGEGVRVEVAPGSDTSVLEEVLVIRGKS